MRTLRPAIAALLLLGIQLQLADSLGNRLTPNLLMIGWFWRHWRGEATPRVWMAIWCGLLLDLFSGGGPMFCFLYFAALDRLTGWLTQRLPRQSPLNPLVILLGGEIVLAALEVMMRGYLDAQTYPFWSSLAVATGWGILRGFATLALFGVVQGIVEMRRHRIRAGYGVPR